ncbi:hypothetical protein EDC01DRAFT_790206 [Geopyxis carbonaria]|nr:hypothetical protein EDC01DRAFT_790206 [Geopyxis carbonaria]
MSQSMIASSTTPPVTADSSSVVLPMQEPPLVENASPETSLEGNPSPEPSSIPLPESIPSSASSSRVPSPLPPAPKTNGKHQTKPRKKKKKNPNTKLPSSKEFLARLRGTVYPDPQPTEHYRRQSPNRLFRSLQAAQQAVLDAQAETDAVGYEFADGDIETLEFSTGEYVPFDASASVSRKRADSGESEEWPFVRHADLTCLRGLRFWFRRSSTPVLIRKEEEGEEVYDGEDEYDAGDRYYSDDGRYYYNSDGDSVFSDEDHVRFEEDGRTWSPSMIASPGSPLRSPDIDDLGEQAQQFLDTSLLPLSPSSSRSSRSYMSSSCSSSSISSPSYTPLAHSPQLRSRWSCSSSSEGSPRGPYPRSPYPGSPYWYPDQPSPGSPYLHPGSPPGPHSNAPAKATHQKPPAHSPVAGELIPVPDLSDWLPSHTPLSNLSTPPYELDITGLHLAPAGTGNGDEAADRNWKSLQRKLEIVQDDQELAEIDELYKTALEKRRKRSLKADLAAAEERRKSELAEKERQRTSELEAVTPEEERLKRLLKNLVADQEKLEIEIEAISAKQKQRNSEKEILPAEDKQLKSEPKAKSAAENQQMKSEPETNPGSEEEQLKSEPESHSSAEEDGHKSEKEASAADEDPVKSEPEPELTAE